MSQEENLKLAREAVLIDIIRSSDQKNLNTLTDYLNGETNLNSLSMNTIESQLEVSHNHDIDPDEFPTISANTAVIDSKSTKITLKRTTEENVSTFTFATASMLATVNRTNLVELATAQIDNWTAEINNKLSQINVA